MDDGDSRGVDDGIFLWVSCVVASKPQPMTVDCDVELCKLSQLPLHWFPRMCFRKERLRLQVRGENFISFVAEMIRKENS